MSSKVSGAGLGFRRSLFREFVSLDQSAVDFIEVAPENWIKVGGRWAKRWEQLTQLYPVYAHGLSLSIGSPAPLDLQLVANIKQFLERYDVRCYSEHLSFCSDAGHLYDLMPIPFTQDAVSYVAKRVQQVQEILARRIALENVSYYAAPVQEMTELEFLLAVLEESDCELLLDVNNIYVNSVNHGYDAEQFLAALPGDRIAYIHIAGHYQESSDLIVDTHGASVIPEVWSLLTYAYELFGLRPTLLERDFNFPVMSELLGEVSYIKKLQQPYLGFCQQKTGLAFV